MDDFEIILAHGFSGDITTLDMIIRLFIAALLGGLIGLDRDLKNKPIDFRAYIIVSSASAMVAMLGIVFHEATQLTDNIDIDYGRLISGVLTGIGFLGAGAILKSSDTKTVIGTATGASIWASAVIGLTIGFGFILLAMIGFLIVFFSLVILGYLMPVLVGNKDREKRKK